MLQLLKIAKNYGERQILKDLTFSFEPGNLYLILGPSGSGKSTLLSLITGLDTPDQGEVLLNHQSLKNLNDTEISELRAQKFGIIFQFFNFLNSLTIKKNILLPTYLTKNHEEGHYQSLLKSLKIEHLANSFPHQVSGGELQRSAIARALINNPEIIIADEPTGNLDQKNAYQVMDIFHDLAKNHHKTVIVVTHNQELKSFADQILELKNYKLQ